MMRRAILPLLSVVLLLTACEKEITVDLPRTDPKLVVEGTIQAGQAPLVILTVTQNYFDPTDISSLEAMFVKDATVVVSDGTTTDTLDQICSSQIPDSLIDEVAVITGLDPELLSNADICVYTDLQYWIGGTADLVGAEGRTYSLSIAAGEFSATSVTTIPHTVPLDSVWFKLAEQEPDDDTLGFLWATLTDPDTMGNGYRWLAKRINLGTDGEPKDDDFVAPFFSVFEDRYINGLTFDFAFNRGSVPYSNADDDLSEEAGYFKRGDTVVVKFVSIGMPEFQFYNSYYNNVASQGDLFSTPANVRSNVSGGIGVWAGWAFALDTVICTP